MAGKDETDPWLDGVLDALRAETERCVAALAAGEIDPADVAGVDRRARAIVNVARAAQAVTRTLAAATNRDEDGMNDDDNGGEASTDELRAELQSRLDRLRSQFERKRREAGLGPGDAYGGAEVGAEAA